MLLKVFCVLSMLSKLPPGVCLRGLGEGGGGATGLINKLRRGEQQLVQASCGISTGTDYNYELYSAYNTAVGKGVKSTS